MSVWQNYMTMLCNTSGNKGVQLAVLFHSGQAFNGALRRGMDLEGNPLGTDETPIFELAGVAEVRDEHGRPKSALLSHFFTADAVERVIIAQEIPRSMSPSGLVVPR